MSVIGIRPEVQQRLAVLVPLVALGLSLFVVYPAWGHYGELNQSIQQRRNELKELKAAPPITPGPLAAAADDVPSEPPQFLGDIRRMAADAHCRLIGFDLSPPGQNASSGPVRALRARIEMEAEFVQVRDFLFRLNHTDRLFVVTDLALTTSLANNPAIPVTGPLHATIEIERYVAPPAPKTT